ncbi:hypothetical protein YERSI8AC_200210 [Enterobacterales bacterium 8AC]|nr:hypothetical protein YERSI8AC_200210 [Enterobacterales bacterium 8AC]
MGRMTALKRVVSLRSTRTLVEASHPSPCAKKYGYTELIVTLGGIIQGWWWGKDSNLRSL